MTGTDARPGDLKLGPASAGLFGNSSDPTTLHGLQAAKREVEIVDASLPTYV
jgi:hypothetical protein